MKNKKSFLFEKARGYAVLLLKFRPRSEREIQERLKKKKFDAEIIKETLGFLKNKGFINDDDFARAWIDSRLKRPLGLRRIRQELKIKGINKEIIDSQIGQIKDNYSEEDIVRKIAQERINKLNGVDQQKAKRRVFAYLLRRGFSPEVVIDAVNLL